MMVARIIVNGARGKMGVLACETLSEHTDFVVAGALSRHDNLAEAIDKLNANIVIDLTRADCVYRNALTIIECGAHPVIGTSGLTAEQVDELKQLCDAKQLGGIIAPNFSLGAILMMRFAAIAARYIDHVEIIEAHHPQKFDAPSGTAKKTAALINEGRAAKAGFSAEKDKQGLEGITLPEIPIHSIRLPGILANQQVIFGNQGETLTLSHNSLDRSCFKSGILLCCQKVTELNSLVYGLESLL